MEAIPAHPAARWSTAWPLIVVLLLLWTAVASLLAASIHSTAGHLTYALDDPYIHMAMAKNFALHGVWGVTSEGFTSSSSSIAWTGLLALFFRILGVREWLPFALNVCIATFTVMVAHRLMIRRLPLAAPPGVFLGLLVFTFATPLPALVFAGQEHILHVLVTLLFLFGSADVIAAPEVPLTSRPFVRLATLATVLPLVRYEGLYPVVIAAVLLTIRGRAVAAMVIAGAGAAPVAAYAAISLRNGWWMAPNSVLLKGNIPDLATA